MGKMIHYKQRNQHGQIAVILLLVLSIILAVASSLVIRATTEIASSTKFEESARAFSAAEAGLEKAIAESKPGETYSTSPVALGLNANFKVSGKIVPEGNNPFLLDSVDKANPAQFWLADPSTLFPTPIPGYLGNKFYIYFGDASVSEDNMPALELRIVYWDSSSGEYDQQPILIDPNESRRLENGFEYCSGGGSLTFDGPRTVSFLCKYEVNFSNVNSQFPIIARARILYSNDHHPVALAPDSCGVDCNLPPQGTEYTSTGTAGQTLRRVQVLRQRDVMPFMFDYVLFTEKDIVKN